MKFDNVLFLVDGFQFQRKDVRHLVLTHFHSDHTIGLTRRFNEGDGLIYCTEITAALVVELIGVDAARVRGLRLDASLEIDGVNLTLLDAGHCPGSAVAAFEDVAGGRVVLHTGDCRASETVRDGITKWLSGRTVDELFLDTTYCSKRWAFPAQTVACEWMRELVAAELAREPKTLFVVGSYQIGKELAVQAVAEAANTPAYVEHRRWRVIQLAQWGEVQLPDGRPLWSIDKEGCGVWMTALGGLGHDLLKHFLASAKGKFNAIVAFRPTGWSWAPRKMAEHGSSACRVWAENDGQTRIYGVPYSEHSSYPELRALAESLRPKKLIPTVNSETVRGKEQMMSHFLGVVDLQADPERMDHYLLQESGSKASASVVASEIVDVLALSAVASASPSARQFALILDQCSSSDCTLAAAASPEIKFAPALGQVELTAGASPPLCRQDDDHAARMVAPRWGAGVLRRARPTRALEIELDDGGVQHADFLAELSSGSCCVSRRESPFGNGHYDRESNFKVGVCNPQDCEVLGGVALQFSTGVPATRGEAVVDLLDSEGGETYSPRACAEGFSGGQVGLRASVRPDDGLRSVDLAQQRRLLSYFESVSRPRTTGGMLRRKLNAKAKAKANALRSAGPLPRIMGVSASATTPKSKRRANATDGTAEKKRSRKAAKPRQNAEESVGGNEAAASTPASLASSISGAGAGADPKQVGERRPTRFVPKPSARVKERIDRAFSHRLYFLASRPLGEDQGFQLDVLGSTGNVYGVRLQPVGNDCSCLDFAKAAGVCKHLLFVTLRILKLPRDDHRVWQTSLVPSELRPLVGQLAQLASDVAQSDGIRAEPAVLRAYAAEATEAITSAASGGGQGAAGRRQALPADCPICFEEMMEAGDEVNGSEAVAYCRSCGHNVHGDCQRRWAAVSQGDVCPLCRGPWRPGSAAGEKGEGAEGAAPLNLAAFSAEHRSVSLMELYPETHRWMRRRD